MNRLHSLNFLNQIVFFKWLGVTPLLLAAIFYHGQLKPAYEGYSFMQKERMSLQSDLISKQHKQRIMSQQFYHMKLEKLNKRLARLPKCLQARTSPRVTVQAILNAGVSTGLTFERFEPEHEIKNRVYLESPLNVEVLGSYPEIVQFIKNILKSHSEVHIDDFEMATTLDTTDTTRERLQMKMRLIICRSERDKTNDY